MPMDFPDMHSLLMAAKVHKFRQPNVLEPESDYRKALADHVAPIDFIESQEIRSAKAWDKWNEGQSADTLIRALTRR